MEGSQTSQIRYEYNGFHISSEEQDGQKTKYLYGTGIDEIVQKTDHEGRKYYFIRDGLNSVRMVVDGMGRVIKRIDYTPFGEIKGDSKDVMFGFTGREYDPESGLYFYRARYYQPDVGRFISKDPIGLKGGMNLYVYVGNNPVNWVDPLGLEKLTVHVQRGQSIGQRNSKGGWGHAWVELETASGNSRTYGSYPNGVSNSDYRKDSDVSVEFDITYEQLQDVMEGIYDYGNDNWSKIFENCTDFVYKAVEDWAGIDLPGSDWGIDYPDDLADLLEEWKNEEEWENENQTCIR